MFLAVDICFVLICCYSLSGSGPNEWYLVDSLGTFCVEASEGLAAYMWSR